jgi:hypothetical protein
MLSVHRLRTFVAHLDHVLIPKHAHWVPRKNTSPRIRWLSTPVGTLTPSHAGWVPPAKKNTSDRQTDMDEPIRCSSLTLERQEHLCTLIKWEWTHNVTRGAAILFTVLLQQRVLEGRTCWYERDKGWKYERYHSPFNFNGLFSLVGPIMTIMTTK